jgi:hypothetical protein
MIRNNKGQFVRGGKFTDEEKKKHSETARRNNFGKWMKGKMLSEETKRKMSLAQMGKHHKTGWKPSEEWKKNQSKIRKGKIPKNISLITGGIKD